MARTLRVDDRGCPVTLDQTRLPFETVWIELADAGACATAIETMQVRGAPLIGAVAAYGLALALRESAGDSALSAAFDALLRTRPTAVNLRWALERVRAAVAGAPVDARAAIAWREAQAIADDDVACNRSIGEHGAAALMPLVHAARDAGRPLQLLTHCNAGALATVDWGTALAPIYLLHQRGVPLHVWVDETRPRNQGASLTAWELAERGVPHTVVADNAGGLLMMRGHVDAAIVGCDRVAANGDVANKVGTYLKALAARAHALPFYVACPVSTIDVRTPDGAAIPIEERSAREVTHLRGRIDGGADDGRLVEVRVVPPASAAANPAFDVTPAALVTGLVTERGVCAASAAGIRGLCPDLFEAAGGAGRPA